MIAEQTTDFPAHGLAKLEIDPRWQNWLHYVSLAVTEHWDEQLKDLVNYILQSTDLNLSTPTDLHNVFHDQIKTLSDLTFVRPGQILSLANLLESHPIAAEDALNYLDLRSELLETLLTYYGNSPVLLNLVLVP